MANVKFVDYGGQQQQSLPPPSPYRSALAEAIMARGMDTQNIRTPIQGLAKLGETAIGAITQRQEAERERARKAQLGQEMSGALQAATPWINPDTGMPAPGTGGREGLAAFLQGASPEMQAALGPQLLASALEPPESARPMTVSPGSIVIDPMTGKQIFSAPPKPDTMSEAALEQQMRLRAAGRPSVSTTVRNQMPGETVAENEAKEYGKQLVARYAQVSDEADAAENNLANLYMLQNMDVSTGALEPTKAWASGLLESLGYDPMKMGLDKATNAQAFTAIANNAVLTKMQAQKGPQTETDAKRIEETVASLGNTPEANQFIMDAAIALEERKVEQRDFFQRWEAGEIEGAPGGTFRGAEKAWNEYKRQTPLLAKHPDTGLPIFFSQIVADNPGVPREELLTYWREVYGGNR